MTLIFAQHLDSQLCGCKVSIDRSVSDLRQNFPDQLFISLIITESQHQNLQRPSKIR